LIKPVLVARLFERRLSKLLGEKVVLLSMMQLSGFGGGMNGRMKRFCKVVVDNK